MTVVSLNHILKQILESFFILTSLIKGCVCYLNRCETSPTYILYQLNEKKKSLQSLIISAFTRSIPIFEKVACQQSASIPQATLVFMKFRTGKSRQASFQIV